MRNWIVCLLFPALMGSLLAQSKNTEAESGPSASPSAPETRSAIEQVLRTQQEAWNRHDRDAFMAGYWNSKDLTFFSGAQRTSGWQGALDRYRKNYQNDGKEIGRLEFRDLQIE